MKYTGKSIYIRLLQISDAEAVLSLHIRNREFFKAYSTTRNEDFYTVEAQRKILEDGILQREQDLKYAFGIFLIETDELIGNVTLAEILRGPLQSCFIGYYMDQNHNGKGYMTEAVRLTVDLGFNELKLHRIEAGVMPHNIRSMKVLAKAGFHKEGIARKNVNINGKWEDHQVLAIIAEE
ncbi:MAG: alanine acetyltransferase [Clostridiales bacterium GWB2_37_7]|nr:MAG: alanine acetyltransferase [Clostridiales bacterium GWB2_37_7]